MEGEKGEIEKEREREWEREREKDSMMGREPGMKRNITTKYIDIHLFPTTLTNFPSQILLRNILWK